MADDDTGDPAVDTHIDHEIDSINRRNSGPQLNKGEERTARGLLRTGFFDKTKHWSHPDRVKARNDYESTKYQMTGGGFDWNEWKRQNGDKSPGQGDEPTKPEDDKGPPLDSGTGETGEEDVGGTGDYIDGDVISEVFDVF